MVSNFQFLKAFLHVQRSNVKVAFFPKFSSLFIYFFTKREKTITKLYQVFTYHSYLVINNFRHNLSITKG